MGKIEVVRALSVKQPWATDLINGKKRIEYRSWPIRELGPLLIVSSKSPKHRDLPLGCALGVIEIISCKWSQKDQCFHWKVKNPMPLDEPIELPLSAAKMRLGVYNVSISKDLRGIGDKFSEFCSLHGQPRSYPVPKKPVLVEDSPNAKLSDAEIANRQQVAASLRSALKDFPKVKKTIRDFQAKVTAINADAGEEVEQAANFFLEDSKGGIKDVIAEILDGRLAL